MARQKWQRITPSLRREVLRMAATGATCQEIGEEVGRSLSVVARLLKPLGGVIRPEEWQPSTARLSLEDRVEIRIGLERGETYAALGRRLGRHRSTICREVQAHGGRQGYRPMAAHRQAAASTRRPKPTKLAAHPALAQRVVADLERLWSPEQIARRLRAEFPDDAEMRVSHETIYKSLYVQGRGELRRELATCLRTGRVQRRPRGRLERRGQISDKVMISERPAEVADRAVPGHWEGDLIMGTGNKSAIGTLVERSTRFVMLLHLPGDHSALTVREAMTKTIATLPEALRRSITWDQGKEMAQHVDFRVETGVPVYFCDPHSPWQRGTNENTNGLLRQYFPKGTDLSPHDPDRLAEVADSLNGRPRKTLGWMTPSEKLAELVAATG